MNVFEGFVRELNSITTEQALREAFSSRIGDLGYHGFDAFTLRDGTIDNAYQSGNLFMCDYGAEITWEYVREGWIQMDPSLREAMRRSKPFDYVDYLRSALPNSSVRW